MTKISQSYLKVQYDIRPGKQVERRMLIDAFGTLSDSGFSIRDYQYTGMGSIHFVDFVMLHKYLGVSSFLSVEIDDKIEKRIKFNKPFSLVDTHIGPIGDKIGELSPDRQHILWLDYDCVVNEEIIQDVVAATAQLSVGSILLITLDAEPPPGEGAIQWREYLIDEVNDYLPQPNEPSDFSPQALPKVYVNVLKKACSSGLAGRHDVKLLPLFNFEYADGHKMLTIGAMIGGESELRKVRGSRLVETRYYRECFESEPLRINVPVVTRKERAYLDAAMPCDDDWSPDEFELSSEEVMAYREIYRFLPAYAELFL